MAQQNLVVIEEIVQESATTSGSVSKDEENQPQDSYYIEEGCKTAVLLNQILHKYCPEKEQLLSTETVDETMCSVRKSKIISMTMLEMALRLKEMDEIISEMKLENLCLQETIIEQSTELKIHRMEAAEMEAMAVKISKLQITIDDLRRDKP